MALFVQKIMDKLIAILLLLCISFSSYSQTNAFDFWVGDWKLSWQGQDNEIKKGQNKIERVLNGKVIQENFTSLEGDESSRLVGKSWTVYDPILEKWKQTWVDNSGVYLDFQSFIEDSIKGFQRSFKNKNGQLIHQRMVFYNIKEDSFTWDWEGSKDAENWTLLWRINYKRKSN